MIRMRRPQVWAPTAILLVSFISIANPARSAGGTWDLALTAGQKQALARISADSLRGNLSFLASDLLQGRPTPSLGQDIAAEFIASQFRRAGLRPAGDDNYYQTVPNVLLTPSDEGFRCRMEAGGKEIEIPAGRFSMDRAQELQIDKAPIFKLPRGGRGPEQIGGLAGKVVVTELPAATDRNSYTRRQEGIDRTAALKPALLVDINRSQRDTGYFSRRFFKNDLGDRTMAAVPVVTLNDAAAAQLFDALPADEAKAASFSLHLSAAEKSWPLHNVVGLLPGSDPALSGSYLLLTAHYDGTGPKPGADPGQIWNAANDNGSGTVSVIEIASALASLDEKPRRSIVFMTFFGEEGGELGSRYYAAHPIFPVEKTVAMINLEQVGRTDSTEGDQTRRASLTGFDYSDIGEVFRRAGELSGITVFKDGQNSDLYFSASDNMPLAQTGVPAHTLCVAFEFPDYHGAGDKWQKIDYENMAATDRMTATAVLMVAQSDAEPRWNASNSKASRYLEAWEQHHPAAVRP